MTAPCSRAVIIGIGGWGLQVVAHLLPRLRFEDQQRSQFPADMPRLSSLTGFAVLLPHPEDGRIELLVPTSRLIPPHFAEETLTHLPEGGWSEERHQHLLTRLREENYLRKAEEIPGLSGKGRVSRKSMHDHFSTHRYEIRNALEEVIRRVMWDENWPGEESINLTIYVICSLAEDMASSILLPFVHSLREGLPGEAEITAFLSLGSFSNAPYRAYEEACVCASLSELQDNRFAGDPSADRSVFDRCYLLDCQKWNGAMARGEQELTFAVGNALEAFLISNGAAFLSDLLAPDGKELRGTYSTLGAATVYLPIDEMLHWCQEHFRAQILQEHFLQAPQDGQMSARSFFHERLSTPVLLEEMVRPVPLHHLRVAGSTHLVEVERDRFKVQSEKGLFSQPPGEWRRRIDGLRERILSDLEGWIGQVQEEAGLSEPEEPAARRFREWWRDTGEAGQAPTLLERLRHGILSRIAGEISADNQGLARAHRFAESLAALVEEERLRLRRGIKEAPEGYEDRFREWQRSFLRLAQERPYPAAVFARFALLAIFAIYMTLLLSPETPFLPAGVFKWGIAGFILLLALGGSLLKFLLYNRRATACRDKYTDLIKEAVDFRAETQVRALLASLFARLGEVIQDTADVVREAGDALREDARRILERERRHLPAGVEGSFLREAKADEALWQSVYEGARKPEMEGLPNLWRIGDGGYGPEEVRLALEYGLAVRLTRQRLIMEAQEGMEQEAIARRAEAMVAGERPFAGARSELALHRLIRGVVDRYLGNFRARMPQISIEEFLRRGRGPGGGNFEPDDFLTSLYHRAKPFINIDEDTRPDMPISIDLVVLHAPSISSISYKALQMKAHPLPSGDPFSITCLRTVHGFGLSAWARQEEQRRSFQRLNPRDRQQIMILGEDSYPQADVNNTMPPVFNYRGQEDDRQGDD